MVNYKIKTVREDEKLGNARVMDVTVGHKKFLTPSKTMDAPRKRYIYEIYQKVSDELMKASREKRTVLDEFPSKCKDFTINMIIPEYTGTSLSDQHLYDLENRIHPHTDVVIIPRWSGILSSASESTLSKKLWKESERYIEEVRRINGKLIMGNIPMHRPLSVIDNLIHRYIKEDVTSFVLDYESCKAPGKAHIVRGIAKRLVDDGLREDSLLYQVNMRKSHDYGDFKPADDFLSFVDGVDILGNFHLCGGGGRPGITKIFSPEHWTYYDGAIGNRNLNDIKAMNHELINIEAEAVKINICEHGSALGLAKNKKGAYEYTHYSDQTELNLGGIGWV